MLMLIILVKMQSLSTSTTVAPASKIMSKNIEMVPVPLDNVDGSLNGQYVSDNPLVQLQRQKIFNQALLWTRKKARGVYEQVTYN